MSGFTYGQAAVDKLKAKVAELEKRNEGLLQAVADLTAQLAAAKQAEDAKPPSTERHEPEPQRQKSSRR